MIIADLHLHGRFSRATSPQLTVENLEKYGLLKGLDILGSGDFTHPKWIEELKSKLSEDGSGILSTSSGYNFVLQTEISLIYTQGKRQRRIHHVVLAPSFEVVDQITSQLKKLGRVDYDGRPIFGISSIEFVELLKGISDDIEIIPAHAWTPWYSIFGSKSGFDSVEECFGDRAKHIYALETGLSSDPPMNWRISALDEYTLVSNSDSHSFWPWRIGREATLFDLKSLTYKNIIKAIRTRQGLHGTVEVDPSYGKYHFDGHRSCGVKFSPAETKKHNGLCPKCKQPLTIGVQYRVEQLADRPKNYIPKNAQKFYTLIPIHELIAALYNTGVAAKRVWEEYNGLIKAFDSEYNVLLNVPLEELEKVCHPNLAEAIIQNRRGEIAVKPGYDGVYGVLQIEPIKTEEYRNSDQKSILDF